MHLAISQHHSGIADICQRFGVRRLEVFGSAARADDFDPANSDVDFLVEFAADTAVSLEAFFGTKAALAQLLGREVDLLEPRAVRNPYVLASINRNRESVYAAGPARLTDSRLCKRASGHGLDGGANLTPQSIGVCIAAHAGAG